MTQTEAPTIVLQPFTPDHLGKAIRLSQEASWPHRVEDWALTLSVCAGVVALDGDDVVGTALCSDFREVVTINMIIVDARMRGRGLGRRLMGEVLTLAGDREQRLIATSDGLPLYEKLGFVPTGEILQYQGVAKAAEPGQPVQIIEQPDFAELSTMDKAACGIERRGLLARLTETGKVLLTDGGFAILRPFGHGHVVGPVVAQDLSAAKALISAAATQTAGRFLRIDMPKALALVDHIEALGLRHAGGGTAMVRNPGHTITSSYKTFALISQAFG